jgi:hypothetical protein
MPTKQEWLDKFEEGLVEILKAVVEIRAIPKEQRAPGATEFAAEWRKYAYALNNPKSRAHFIKALGLDKDERRDPFRHRRLKKRPGLSKSILFKALDR